MPHLRPRSAVVVMLALAVVAPSRACPPEPRYDFRDTDAYRALEPGDRQRLEQVVRDFALLWGALDMYADEHAGAAPARLEELCPDYLLELPRDPFVDPAMLSALGDAGEPATDGRSDLASVGGLGYGYRAGGFQPRAWCVSSVGLPDFPFLAAEGNVGLYRTKGTWLGGEPIMPIGVPTIWRDDGMIWIPTIFAPDDAPWAQGLGGPVLGPGMVVPPLRFDGAGTSPGVVILPEAPPAATAPADPAQPARSDGR